MSPADLHLLPRARGPLTGTVTVPGDKSISHRAALLALLADGPCRADGWLASDDTLASLRAVELLGAAVRRDGGRIEVAPPARRPVGELAIDCGNSGTTARLLCGLLAGWLPPGAAVTLSGDASLSSRPMNRVVEPLRAMGADISFLGPDGRLPLRVAGAPLRGRHHDLPVPSAQVKSALLLAGLGAEGVTSLAGAAGSRDHTELLLHTMGVSCAADGGAAELAVAGGARPGRFAIRVPADPSTAAFFHVAAALVPGSDVLTPGLSLNPTRIGALQVLRRAGAAVSIERPSGPPGGEPSGDVRVRPGPLRAFAVGAAEMPRLVDEIPVLAVLATAASGTTRITGAAELRVKESDRLALMAANLGRLGARVVEHPDGLEIAGPQALSAGVDSPVVLPTAHDHRIAMAMAVAALVTKGHSALEDRDCVGVSFPGFFAAWEELLASGTSDRPF